MAENYLELPFAVKVINRVPSVNGLYGLYESIEDAQTKIPTALKVKGLLVGIEIEGLVVVHIYQLIEGVLTPVPIGGKSVKMTGTFMNGTLLKGVFTK